MGDNRPHNPNNPIVVAREVNNDGRIYTQHYYWCPGCDTLHAVAINPGKNGNGAGWTFTGTLEKPTYTPSELTTWTYGEGETKKEHRCHTFITDGVIDFLSDCTHELRGKVPMIPLPDWFVASVKGD
jgi:hypothetical protein